MKKLLFTLLVFTSVMNFASAQSAYHIAPIPADTTGEDEDMPAHADIKNLTGNTIRLHWERTIISLTSGCETGVCDPNTCYARHIGFRDVDMDPNETGELTVHFYRNGAHCEGIVHVKVTNRDNPSDSTTAVYMYNIAAGVNDLPKAEVKLFPNPFTSYFSLENAENVGYIRVYTLDGREVLQYAATADNRYALAGQPQGNYILALLDKQGRLFQALEVKKQ